MRSSAAGDVSADLRGSNQLFFFSAFLARFSLRVNWGSRLPLGFDFCSLLAMTVPIDRGFSGTTFSFLLLGHTLHLVFDHH